MTTKQFTSDLKLKALDYYHKMKNQKYTKRRTLKVYND